MPHKHKRNRRDDNDFDLPPTKIARSLSVSKLPTGPNSKSKPKQPTKGKKPAISKSKPNIPTTTTVENATSAPGASALKAVVSPNLNLSLAGGIQLRLPPKVESTDVTSKKRGRSSREKDDTPREFKRLMRIASGYRPGSMLDNGDRGKKTKKKSPKEDKSTSSTSGSAKLTIRPGESMSDFSARVNQSISVTGLAHKSKPVEGVRQHVPAHVRKIQKRQAHYVREDDRKRAVRDKQVDQLEELEENTVEMYGDVFDEMDRVVESSKGRKGKRGKSGGRKDEDPWAVLKEKRKESERKGLHDVVHAPPSFSVIPTVKLKSREDRKVALRNALMKSQFGDSMF